MPLIYKPYQATLANKEGQKLYYPRLVKFGKMVNTQKMAELSLQKRFLRHLRQRRAISIVCMRQTSRLKQRLRQLPKKYMAQEVLIIRQQLISRLHSLNS